MKAVSPGSSLHEAAIEVILEAITLPGIKPGRISTWHWTWRGVKVQGRQVYLESTRQVMTSEEMVEFYTGLVQKYPIISIEDGLAEEIGLAGHC
jgi:enolase